MSVLPTRVATLAFIAMLAAPCAAFAADTEETPASATMGDFDTARALVDSQEYDKALPMLHQLDHQGPNNPDVLNLIGFSLRKTGKVDEALDYYSRALALNPQHRGANEYLGELYLEMKQPEKAKERLAVLSQTCGDCEEFEDLSAQIDRYAAQ